MASLLGRDGVRMAADEAGKLHNEGVAALALMEEALELLDRCDGVLHVVPHLDLAICRLREAIDLSTSGTAARGTAPTTSSGGPAAA